MFGADARGRLTGRAPHLHILRTPGILICRCHAQLGDEVAGAIEALAHRPRGRPSEWAREYADYARLLAAAAPLKAIRSGPLYDFPGPVTLGEDAVSIDATNAGLLRGGLDEWLPDVAAGLPMSVTLAGGRAVAVCASVKASQVAHCAGVETLPQYRGRGFAAQAVAGWARAVMARGAAPIYGTTFDNLASQGVARRLGLRLIAAEFSIECQTG
jgi:hypothetical protein